ncbi:uncharacterized protein BDW43DRAFT_222052 [Aspergillus alliaceus]|uniref:uncharacterized protein n=1 Tax=Petromyces alliaceus TaxID=209559 RepID=UPI0012A6EEFD|nr:uncharacterized protein BDW43DRAFT_222052 [Aspergillus alliaceus]KAB8228203.1 hypothetical protein BDW43DRAFT_222052 [Aspergillus alliaceus]
MSVDSATNVNLDSRATMCRNVPKPPKLVGLLRGPIFLLRTTSSSKRKGRTINNPAGFFNIPLSTGDERHIRHGSLSDLTTDALIDAQLRGINWTRKPHHPLFLGCLLPNAVQAPTYQSLSSSDWDHTIYSSAGTKAICTLEQMTLSDSNFPRVFYDLWAKRALVALVEPITHYPFSDLIPYRAMGRGITVLIPGGT